MCSHISSIVNVVTPRVSICNNSLKKTHRINAHIIFRHQTQTSC